MKMNNDELYLIKGGASLISYNMINALCRLVDTLLDLGRTIGKAIKNYIKK